MFRVSRRMLRSLARASEERFRLAREDPTPDDLTAAEVSAADDPVPACRDVCGSTAAKETETVRRDGEDDDDGKECCCICREPFAESGSWHACGHPVHRTCMAYWIAVVRKTDCPVCRRFVGLDTIRKMVLHARRVAGLQALRFLETETFGKMGEPFKTWVEKLVRHVHGDVEFPTVEEEDLHRWPPMDANRFALLVWKDVSVDPDRAYRLFSFVFRNHRCRSACREEPCVVNLYRNEFLLYRSLYDS